MIKTKNLDTSFLKNFLRISVFFFINDDIKNQSVNQKQNQSKIIIIDKFDQYFIICFDKTIITILTSNINLLQDFFKHNKDSNIFALFTNTEKNNNDYDCSLNLEQPIEIFNKNEFSDFYKKFFEFSKNKWDCNNIWTYVQQCVYSYLIKKAFIRCDIDRFEKYKIDTRSITMEKEMKSDSYIDIKTIGVGSLTFVKLIYHIEREEFLAAKLNYNDNSDELIRRENNNYLSISHPLFPHYYGIVNIDREQYIVTEYIHGKSLHLIAEMNLKIEEKIFIIYEILNIIDYIHNNKFIYRDLKPNNLIVDNNKNIVLIDFDRMIKKPNLDDSDQMTLSFSHVYCAPEIINSSLNITEKADIYSIGLITVVPLL